MTKLTAMKAFLALAMGSAAASSPLFRPHRISMEDLVSKDSSTAANQALLEALGKSGIVAITNINFSTNDEKFETLASLHACAAKSQATKEHVYPDGTRRLTMATHTVPNDNADANSPTTTGRIDHGSKTPKSCKAFDQASELFRQQVAHVTDAFAQRLGAILSTEEPLLSTTTGETFDTIGDIVRKGEHLEHFHSYQSSGAPKEEALKNDDDTIEWHTDQGLFLVFTPGTVVDKQTGDLTLSEGFHIKLSDGSSSMVRFDRQDDLVIMLGDGVHQYINNDLSSSSSSPLHATPHALSLAPTQAKTRRVWYGRMVLPPSNALHPMYKVTFGELRHRMIDSGNEQDNTSALSLGCSDTLQARQLEESSCEADTLWCWHRCMPVAPANVSESICAAQELDLACINPERMLWDGEHADADAGYVPGCIDLETAKNATGSSHADHNKTATDDHSDHDHDDGGDKDVHGGGGNDESSALLFFGSSWMFGTTILAALSFF